MATTEAPSPASTGRPGPKQARSRATRRRILDAAVGCLVERGYAGSSTTAICQRAGVSQGALFKHFVSKIDLLGTATRHLFAGMIEDYRRAFGRLVGQGPGDRLGAAIGLLRRTFAEPRLQAAFELDVAARTNADLRAAIEPVLRAHRDDLLAVARELFAKQGFQATTVDEIAQLADVAPATFFNHFKSKQALLGLMTGEVFEYLHSLTKQHLEGEGSGAEKLRAFMSSAAAGIAANRGVARDVLLEFMRSDATPDGPHPYLQRLIAPFIALIEEGQRNGEMRTDHDAAFLAQMAVGMLNSAITNWLANPDYPVETGLLEATEFTLDTLSQTRLDDARVAPPGQTESSDPRTHI